MNMKYLSPPLRLGLQLIGALIILAAIQVRESDYLYAEERGLDSGVKEHIDVVLLLDASGSMRRTDPLRLRDEGARLIVEFLKPGDRLGIIEFSNFANTIRPLSEFDSSQVQEITQQIAQVGDSGLYTDLLQGIKIAANMLDLNPQPDSDRVVVLLSDGQMEPDPQVATSTQQIDELNEVMLPRLRSGSIKIHSVALSELADRKLLTHISQQTDGLAVSAPSADQIHESFQEIFLAVKKPQVITMTSRGFPIDDGIKEATFYINHDSSSDPSVAKEEIKLENPSGDTIGQHEAAAENIQWYRGSKFDVVTILEPEVGTWKIEGLPSSESFATVMTNLRLVTEFPGATINSGDDIVLQARFYDSKKPVSLPELTGVVEYTYEIIPTDKISEPIQRDFLRDDGKLGDRRADDGIFSARINLEEEGEYRLTVTAKAPTFVRQQQVPFKVKPRLVAVYVEEREIEQIAKAHSEDKKEESKHEEEGEGANTAEPETEEYFIVKLSEETGPIKEKVLRLLAIDSEQKRYNLPLTQSQEDKYRYQVRTRLLPHEGEFEMKATLAGQGKKRERITAESNRFLFQYVKNKNAPKVEVVEVVEHKEEVKQKEVSIWPWALLLAFLNGAAGFVAVHLTRKSVSGISITAEDYQAPTETIEIIAKLKKILERSEASLSDPMFADSNLQALKSRSPLNLDALGSGTAVSSISKQNEEGEVKTDDTEAGSSEGSDGSEIEQSADAEKVQDDSTVTDDAAGDEQEEVAPDQVASSEEAAAEEQSAEQEAEEASTEKTE